MRSNHATWELSRSCHHVVKNAPLRYGASQRFSVKIGSKGSTPLDMEEIGGMGHSKNCHTCHKLSQPALPKNAIHDSKDNDSCHCDNCDSFQPYFSMNSSRVEELGLELSHLSHASGERALDGQKRHLHATSFPCQTARKGSAMMYTINNTEDHEPDDIVQIISATGWYAKYSDDENGGTFIEPLLGWALIHNGDVVGLAPCGPLVGACPDDANFLRYVHERDLVPGRDSKDEDTDKHRSV